MDIRIVIARHGWVWAGCYQTVGKEVELVNAVNIRRWGGSLGLLASDGPQDGTQLEPAAKVRIPRGSVIGTLICRQDVWQEVLGLFRQEEAST